MKALLPFIALIFFLLSSAHTHAESTPSLNMLMTKHTDAMGGLLNWSRVESIRLSGTVERDGQTAEIVIVKKRPNKIRATVTLPIPGRVGEYMQLIRAHDGKTGWTATRLAGAHETIKTRLDEADATTLLADAGVLPKLLQLWRTNQPLELTGLSTFEGRETYIIELDDESSDTRHRFYLDAKNYRTVAHEIHSPTETVLNKLSAYEAHRGVYLATHSEITTETTGRSIMRTESIEIGVGIYKEYFSQTP